MNSSQDLKSSIRTAQGFSLSEVIVVLFITSIVMSAIAALSIWGAKEFRRLQAEISAQRDVLRLEASLRSYIAQGINVINNNIPQGGLTLNGRRGRFLGPGGGTGFRNCNSISGSEHIDCQNEIVTIGAFYREWGFTSPGQAATELVGEPRPTGIFFLRPQPSTGLGILQNSKAGVIFIDTGAKVEPGVTVNPTVEPGYNDNWFAGVTEISARKKVTERIHEEGSRRLIGYTIRFNMRFHLNDSSQLTFCPTADIGSLAGCDDSASPYFDIQREVRVTLANNDLYFPLSGQIRHPVTGAVEDWVYERPLGFLHFFRPVFPDVFEN